MSLTANEIIQVLEKAKELGVTAVKVDGFEATLHKAASSPSKPTTVPEAEAHTILNPMSPFDDILNDPELVKYYATPYFDELIAQRELRKQQLDLEAKERKHG